MIPTISHLTMISLPLLTYTGLAVLKCRNWQSCTSLPERKQDYSFRTGCPGRKKRKYGMRINTSYLANAVAMIAVAALFFFLPAPVENTEVMEANYARLLPGDLFGR